MRPFTPSRPPPAGDAQTDGALFDPRGARDLAMASKYVWWQEARETLEDPCLLAAQIMTLGTLDDVRWLLGRASRGALRRVLRDPPIGIFNERSWRFWRLQLGMAPMPMPARSLPA